MSEFRKYRRTNIAEMRPYVEGEELSDRVSVSASDHEDGSPKFGDMIARNPENHADQWLVAADYFAANFAALGDGEGRFYFATDGDGHNYLVPVEKPGYFDLNGTETEDFDPPGTRIDGIEAWTFTDPKRADS